MRVVAGQFGGRLFDSPATNRTHPMSDKMRGALFNILGDLEGLTVLDPFGGTGALSFEAISRGAISAVIIEADAEAQKTIQKNIHTLGLENHVVLVRATAQSWLRTTDRHFDIVLCDPPYDDVQASLLANLTKRVHQNGIFVLSFPADEVAPKEIEIRLVKQQRYGDAQLLFYQA